MKLSNAAYFIFFNGLLLVTTVHFHMSNVSSETNSLLKAQLEQLAKEIEETAKTRQTRHPQRWRGKPLSE